MTHVTHPCHSVFRFHSSTIALLAVLTLTTGLAAQDGGDATRPEAQPAAGVAAEDWASRRREAEQRLLEAQQQLDGFVEQNPSAQPPQWITEEIELLQYLELVYAQRESAQKLRLELQQDAANLQQRLDQLRNVGPTEERPFSFLLLDQLRDQHTGAISRQEGLRAEIEASAQIVASLRETRDQSESKRRQLREQLETADSQDRVARERELKLAQLYSEVLGAAIGYRTAELENSKLALANAEQHTLYLQEKIEVVEQEAKFSQADLDTILAELSEAEEEVRASIAAARGDLQRAEQRWLEARHEAESHPEDQVTADEKVQARQVERETAQDVLTILNERMADVILCRHVWNRRFRLASQSFPAEQYREWLDEATTFGNRLEQEVNRSRLRVREAMETLATLEERLLLAQRDNPDQAQWIQAQIDALQKEVNASGISLVRIDRVQRLMEQYLGELASSLGTGENVWGERIFTGLKTCWNYELTAIDDRPITVKKIITGLILLMVGYFLSRYLARLVGRRLLPRIGLDPGVTSALQTIAFYILLVTFSLFSLQLISIPLTVFAFLGGAVAIGVGFGSQNILNNFISGLILLAERPIRVGDLVEIDGLHGNVENIGARSTRVRTGANLEIIVPNSTFLENNVTNLTLSDTRIRTMVSVGVAYGSPTRDVDRLLREAVASRSDIHLEPEPIVLFKEFGDNSLLFEIHFWINARTIMQAQKIESEVRHTIDDLCRQAEITIAFPQRDVHLDTVRPIEVNLRALADDVENRFGSLQQRRAA
jgi:potassium efflux system protein